MDPISDMLTRVRNALAIKKPEVVLPYSKFKASLASVLEKHGLIRKSEITEGQNAAKTLKLVLKYDETGSPTIEGLLRVSKPGQRIYSKVTKIPKVKLGRGITIISTSKGLMTDKEARGQKLGGEIICQIW